MTVHLTMEQRELARRLHAKGLSLREIGRQVGCSHEVVRTVVRRNSKRPVRSQPWRPPGRLTWPTGRRSALGCVPGTHSRLSRSGWAGRSRRSRERWPATAVVTTTGRGALTSVPGSVLAGPRQRS
jgi:hypothetical protein